MEFGKNTNLINTICTIQVRSIEPLVDIPSLTEIYTTPSRIQYTVRSSQTRNGNLHNKRLILSYPGLSDSDFLKFDELIKGLYQVVVRTDKNEIYELAPAEFPMECGTSFDMELGTQIVFSSSSPLSIKYIETQTPVPIIPGQAPPPLIDEGFDYEFNFNLA